ncbi:MAG: gliding motility-associated ABC transporter ATP-binding subunit GldA [Bacteroidetes bacterium]|nr:gliding motility-associated ABC transporter ATP-binding subunit GldA [Bacteroidota bacterium]
MSIEVRNLVKTFGNQTAVNQISFSVQKGEITGFLGPNGAGKSTTMKMITGYWQPDAGTVHLCGLDVEQNTLAVQEKIGYLPESNPLYPDLYVREYLGFIADLHRLKNKKQAIDNVMNEVGLSVQSHKKIGQLSKGYQQRVGLAAALIHDPEVLILDEPTSGLDPNQIAEIRQVIRRLGKEKTILLSSHIMQEVEAVCDRVIIIHQGKLMADDKLAHLKQSQQQQIVRVEFAEKVQASILEQLSDAKSFKQSATGGWEISCTDADALRKQLLNIAVAQNLTITSLGTAESSLEEVFRKLTQTPVSAGY